MPPSISSPSETVKSVSSVTKSVSMADGVEEYMDEVLVTIKENMVNRAGDGGKLWMKGKTVIPNSPLTGNIREHQYG